MGGTINYMLLNAIQAREESTKNSQPDEYFMQKFMNLIELQISDAVQQGLFETFVILPRPDDPGGQCINFSNINCVLADLGYTCKLVNTRGLQISWKG